MRPFTVQLRQALSASGLSQAEFARRVRMSPAAISQTLRGKNVPKWKRGRQWADTLGLTGLAARDFIEALALAGASPPVQQFVRRLRSQRR